jgi:hypothetical protein
VNRTRVPWSASGRYSGTALTVGPAQPPRVQTAITRASAAGLTGLGVKAHAVRAMRWA